MASHAGMQRIKQAAIKLVEQSEFKYKMTANAKEQGLQRLGKQEALLKARAAYRQRTRVSDTTSERYNLTFARHAGKSCTWRTSKNVRRSSSGCEMMSRTGGGRSSTRRWSGRDDRV